MDINFKNRKLENIFNDEKKLKATYGDVRGEPSYETNGGVEE